jgi:hypothetical protein
MMARPGTHCGNLNGASREWLASAAPKTRTAAQPRRNHRDHAKGQANQQGRPQVAVRVGEHPEEQQ